MKSKRLKQTIAGLGALLALGVSRPVFADETSKVDANVSVTQSSQHRFDAGFEPFEGSITEATASVGYRGLDAFVWEGFNNNRKVSDEVDIGAGYSRSFLNDKINARVGIERWMYTHHGGNNEVFIVGLGYSDPIDVDLGFKQMLDAQGREYSVKVSKPFDLKVRFRKEIPVTFIPFAKTTCLENNYFGVNECPSNNIYGASLSTPINGVDVRTFVKYHDGRGTFDNDTVYGVNFTIPFPQVYEPFKPKPSKKSVDSSLDIAKTP